MSYITVPKVYVMKKPLCFTNLPNVSHKKNDFLYNPNEHALKTNNFIS